MKRLFTLLAFFLAVFTAARAQQADIGKAAKRYKAASTLVTAVKQTRHNAALTKDVVTTGHFYYKKPNSLSMVFEDSKEMLLAVNNTFVMVRDGKQHVAKTGGGNPYEILQDVFRNLLSSGDGSKLTDMADVKTKSQGNVYTITITPAAADAKAKRRTMFTSCTVTVDLKAGELRSVRINERGENYTQYDFSDYSFNAEIKSGAFEAGTVM